MFQLGITSPIRGIDLGGFILDSPIELQAHTQVPRHDLVPRNSVVKRVKPVQHHLSYGKISQLIIALRLPALEVVRGIGASCRDRLKLSPLWSIVEALDCS
tara:strand:+ start:272 stop:574 length:303 start_codon:yes stop_codon:yes gene_type:complete